MRGKRNSIRQETCDAPGCMGPRTNDVWLGGTLFKKLCDWHWKSWFAFFRQNRGIYDTIRDTWKEWCESLRVDA